MAEASLTIVGTGYRLAGHLTAEAEASLAACDRVFYLVSQPGLGRLLRSLNPSAESLHDCYREGRDGVAASEEMVERVVSPLLRDESVCAAFSGHPSVAMYVPRECLRRARGAGVRARLLPAVSVLDCLFADLGLDPGAGGCQLFEATEFLLRPKVFDPQVPLVLLQAGALGVVSWRGGTEPHRPGLRLLAEALLRRYPPEHESVVYEIGGLPPWEPTIERVRLASLADASLSVASTVFLPPLGRQPSA